MLVYPLSCIIVVEDWHYVYIAVVRDIAYSNIIPLWLVILIRVCLLKIPGYYDFRHDLISREPLTISVNVLYVSKCAVSVINLNQVNFIFTWILRREFVLGEYYIYFSIEGRTNNIISYINSSTGGKFILFSRYITLSQHFVSVCFPAESFIYSSVFNRIFRC